MTALRALAARPAPVKPPGPVGALTDRVLVHTSWDTGQRLLDALAPRADGLVLRGGKAGAGVRELRKGGFGGVLVIDSESYAVAAATAEAPFVLPQDGLFEVTLEQILKGQRDCGATVALTPTGYLRAGDGPALKAAADTVATLDRDDVLFCVPIDIAWLNEENIGQLIAVLARLDTPKAVFLGGQFDPLQRYKAAVSNLRRLVAEAGHIAVFRTDLTGFDVLTHGAFATSIGTGGSLRHIIPFGQKPRSGNNKDQSPSVLFPDLMAYVRGSKLAQRFADARPPGCSCSACGGRNLDTFLGRRDSAAAHAHGVCIWSEWISDMLGQPTLADRATWWHNRCRSAVDFYDVVNTQLDQPGAFEAPTPLKAWAELPAWPSLTQPSPRRTRTR
jgi:hypothetical protein